jgi:hypothetical protein
MLIYTHSRQPVYIPYGSSSGRQGPTDEALEKAMSAFDPPSLDPEELQRQLMQDYYSLMLNDDEEASRPGRKFKEALGNQKSQRRWGHVGVSIMSWGHVGVSIMSWGHVGASSMP